MKSTEDYINKVYEKFEETQKNHIYYKPVKIKENNTLAIISSVAICMVLLFTISYTKWQNGEEFVENENSNINYVENLEDGTKTYVQYKRTDTYGDFAKDDLEYISKESDLIAIISDYHSNEKNNVIIENENITIYTNGYVNIEKIYKDDEKINNKKITYSEIGGKLLIKDFESEFKNNWNTWEKNYIGKVLTDDERETSYFEQIPTKKVNLQSNTKYLAFLHYKKDIGSYVLISNVYGALEYNPDTNMVKNPISGEFEEFDWSILDN